MWYASPSGAPVFGAFVLLGTRRTRSSPSTRPGWVPGPGPARSDQEEAPLREYETTVIVQPEISDEGIGSLRERLDGVLQNAKSVRLLYDDQGRRRLAYEIEKFQKGRYLMLHFLDEGQVVPDLERALRLEDSVLRFLTVQVSETVVDVEARVAEAAEQERIRAQKAAERAAREAEETARAAEEEKQRAAEAEARHAEALAAQAAISEEASTESEPELASAAESEPVSEPAPAPAPESEPEPESKPGSENDSVEEK